MDSLTEPDVYPALKFISPLLLLQPCVFIPASRMFILTRVYSNV